MKKLRLLIIFSVLVCAFMTLVACNLPAFPAPPNVRVDDGVYTLLWNEVKGARGYIVSINGDETETTRNRLDISGLATDKEYTFKVKALGNRTTNSNSAWSEPITVFKEYENGLSYKYINGNTEYELTGIGFYNGSVVEVPAYFRGKPVTRVANSAFYNNPRMTKIILPNTIKYIGENAFRNCTILEEVEIPDSVTSMGANTFQGCRNLTKVVIGSSLKVIPEKAFASCRSLSDVTISEGVEEISSSAFSGCANSDQGKQSLTTLKLPDSLKRIGDFAFESCYSLTSLSVNHVETIGKRAFQLCRAITNLNLGTSLLEIGEYAFYCNLELTSVVIPDTVTTIGARAFQKCEKLANVEIGDNITSIGREAFTGTALYEAADNVVYIGTTENGQYVRKWIVETKDGTQKNVEIPDGIVGIASYGFYMLPYRDKEENNRIIYNALERIEIVDSVKYINSYAFRSNRNMTYVKLGNGVEEIGEGVFSNCANLVDFEIDKQNSSLKSIGAYAFSECTSLGKLEGSTAYVKDLTFPDTLTSIGYKAFENTYFWTKTYGGVVYVGGWVVGYPESDNPVTEIEIADRSPYSTDDEMYSIPTVGIAGYSFFTAGSITSVKLPSTLKYLCEHAFHSCSSLMYVEIPEGITEIGDFTFYKCTALGTDTIEGSFKLPKSVKSIGRYAFYKAPLQNIDLSGVEEIGEGAFSANEYLRDVKLGENLKTIGDRAFSSSGIISIEIPDGVKEIAENTFSNCSSLNNVKIGSGVEKIGRYAFNNCSSLAGVYLPDSVKVIDDYAFRKCEMLINLTMSNNLESIGKGAFYDCKWLDYIVLPSSLKLIDNQAFRNCESMHTLVIKEGSVETMGNHVFYGCNYLTIFTDMQEAPEGWEARWNTAFRPVLFGCTLGIENGLYYVESFVKDQDTLVNSFLRNVIEAPLRAGYNFVCWENEDGTAQYKADDIYLAPNGTALTAVWERA